MRVCDACSRRLRSPASRLLSALVLLTGLAGCGSGGSGDVAVVADTTAPTVTSMTPD